MASSAEGTRCSVSFALLLWLPQSKGSTGEVPFYFGSNVCGASGCWTEALIVVMGSYGYQLQYCGRSGTARGRMVSILKKEAVSTELL